MKINLVKSLDKEKENTLGFGTFLKLNSETNFNKLVNKDGDSKDNDSD